MSNHMRIALSLAIVLGCASGATAATKHQKHRHPGTTTIERRTPQDPYGSYGMATTSGDRKDMHESSYMALRPGTIAPAIDRG
jgi:hypothetical protein